MLQITTHSCHTAARLWRYSQRHHSLLRMANPLVKSEDEQAHGGEALRVHQAGRNGTNEPEQATHGQADAKHDQEVGEVSSCNADTTNRCGESDPSCMPLHATGVGSKHFG